MLSDLGSWASIISLVIAFFAGTIVCKLIVKKKFKMNKIFAFLQIGDNEQNIEVGEREKKKKKKTK